MKSGVKLTKEGMTVTLPFGEFDKPEVAKVPAINIVITFSRAIEICTKKYADLMIANMLSSHVHLTRTKYGVTYVNHNNIVKHFSNAEYAMLVIANNSSSDMQLPAMPKLFWAMVRDAITMFFHEQKYQTVESYTLSDLLEALNTLEEGADEDYDFGWVMNLAGMFLKSLVKQIKYKSVSKVKQIYCVKGIICFSLTLNASPGRERLHYRL